MKRRTTPPKQFLPLQTRTGHTQSHRPHPMCKVDKHQCVCFITAAPALINICHDARFAPHVGDNVKKAGYHPSHNTLSTPPITSSRIPTQLTTSHSWRGRTGLERHDIEADVDKGGPPGRLRPRVMRSHPAPAPAPSPLTRRSPQHTPLQTTHTAGNPHTVNGLRPEDYHTLPHHMGVLRTTPAGSLA